MITIISRGSLFNRRIFNQNVPECNKYNPTQNHTTTINYVNTVLNYPNNFTVLVGTVRTYAVPCNERQLLRALFGIECEGRRGVWHAD
jgi:hypothetical protein